LREQRREPALGPEYRVRRHRPWCTLYFVVVAGLVVGAGGWSLYRLGVQHGGYDARQAQATEAHLRIQVDALRDRIAKQARRNTLLERANRIDAEALGRLRDTVASRGEEVTQLEEELAFYQNVVSPAKTSPGLRVRRIRMDGMPGEGAAFRYEIVLTQLNGDDTYTNGRVNFRIKGRRGDSRASVGYEDITEDDGEIGHGFRFKYFQTLRGRIELPDAFDPLSLVLQVEPEGERLDPVEKTYPWNSLLAGGS